MKGRFWALWAVGTTLAALAVMVLTVFPLWKKPAVTEQLPPPVSHSTVRPEGKRVDLNSAGPEELAALPGVGRSRAEAILNYRESRGPFRYPEELIYVPGFGETLVESLLELVTAGGG